MGGSRSGRRSRNVGQTKIAAARMYRLLNDRVMVASFGRGATRRRVSHVAAGRRGMLHGCVEHKLLTAGTRTVWSSAIKKLRQRAHLRRMVFSKTIVKR